MKQLFCLLLTALLLTGVACANASPRSEAARLIATVCGPMDESFDQDALKQIRALAERDVKKVFRHVPDAVVEEIQVYTNSCTARKAAEALHATGKVGLLFGDDTNGYMMVRPMSEEAADWLIVTDNVLIVVRLGRALAQDQS
jgi:hypothetical protein